MPSLRRSLIPIQIHFVYHTTGSPEFTSLCPITGQPDFAHLVLDYIPGEHLMGPKALNSSSVRFEIMVPFTKTAQSIANA